MATLVRNKEKAKDTRTGRRAPHDLLDVCRVHEDVGHGHAVGWPPAKPASVIENHVWALGLFYLAASDRLLLSALSKVIVWYGFNLYGV